MKGILLVTFLFLSFNSISQLNVVIIGNNNNNNNDLIKEVLDELTQIKSFKKLNYRVLKYNEEKSEKEEENYNNTRIEIVKLLKNCEFDFCNELTNLISQDFSQSIYLYTQTSFNCIGKLSLNELTVNSSLNADFIKSKLSYHLKQYRKVKKSTTIFFNYLSQEENTFKPEVTIENSSITLKKGDFFELEPIFSSEPKEIIWNPTDGLSCQNCSNPKFTGYESKVYTLNYIDENQCSSNFVDIYINVIPDCDSSSKLRFPEIDLKLNNFIKLFNEDYEYQIRATSSGGKRFDIPFTKDCGEFFKITVNDLSGSIVESFEKDRESGENNANYYLGENSDYFIFQIDFQKNNGLELGATITIESYDKEWKKINVFKSPVVSFSVCQ